MNLGLIPRAFQPAGDSFDDRFHFLGPLLGRREQREPWSPPDPDAPVLYTSLGTIFTDNPVFYRTCIEALRDGPWQVAMTIGDQDRAAIGPSRPGSTSGRASRNPRCSATRGRSSRTPV